jgi:hypothetical protein
LTITSHINDKSQVCMHPKFWKDESKFQNAFPGEALFKGVNSGFGLHNVEKCFSGKRILKCWFGLRRFESVFGKVGFDLPT